MALRRLHLWLGLSLGLLFVVLGLTGSALVFHVGIDESLHPIVRGEAGVPGPGWSSPVWDRALATARERGFDPAGKWSFEVTGEGGAIPARYYPPFAPGSAHAPRSMVWFSADGARILRIAPWGGYLMSWLYELHMQLLAGEPGLQVVGWSGVVLLVLLASGIAAWWPRGSWAKALTFKRHAAPIRRVRDLHKLAGVGSAGLLVVLVATGVILALPGVKAVLLAPDAVPEPRSAAGTGARIAVRQALATARRAVPDGRPAFIDVPGAADVPFRIRVQVPGDPHRRFPGSFVFVDRQTARVLAVHDVRHGNAGTAIVAWVRPLHDGSVGGLPVRILAVATGFVPAILFGTGLLHWQRRRRGAFLHAGTGVRGRRR